MSRKERLQMEAQKAMEAFEASSNTPENESSQEQEPQAVEKDNFRAELEAARAEKEQLAREREEFKRERDSYSSALQEKETAAQAARREAQELRDQIAREKEERELQLSESDYDGLDPDIVPILKKIIEKQSRAIAGSETKRLREELETSLLSRAKTEVMAEVDSRQYRSTFDSNLRSDGNEDVYEVINSDGFKDFVKGDDLRLLAFTSAASTKDETSARVLKRLVKDFKEKAVKKPAQTPRVGGRFATVLPDDEDTAVVDHAQIMRMVKSSDPAERKRGKDLLNKAAERMASSLSKSRQPAYS